MFVLGGLVISKHKGEDMSLKYDKSTAKYDMFEVSLEGPSGGNPYIEQSVSGVFRGAHEEKEVDGFYDGDGIYRVRFMPSFEGDYNFSIKASFLDGEESGAFHATENRKENHGVVRVSNTFHFSYDDGTRYIPSGTTCYVWELQDEKVQKETLESLASGPFNKIRFCLTPKHYVYNLTDPISFPYEGTPVSCKEITKDNFLSYKGRPEGNNWDYKRFNPRHFQHIDECIVKLGEMGIEADLIVMHPYDRWGFSMMSEEEDDLYWKYVIARFSAYHNVWWSLANEYDLFPTKTDRDWERFASIICEKDKYSHLRSIHNCRSFYDYSRPWITHCSMQRIDLYKTTEDTDKYRERWNKPVVWDEIAYEGNIQLKWGNITGKELVRRYWEAAIRGGYGQHSETLPDNDILWWSHGGKLHGESPERIRFLNNILQEGPECGLAPYTGIRDDIAGIPDSFITKNSPVQPYYLIYYGFFRPSFKEYHFDDESRMHVEVIDTWEMTVTDLGIHTGKIHIDLPGKEYMAVRITKV